MHRDCARSLQQWRTPMHTDALASTPCCSSRGGHPGGRAAMWNTVRIVSGIVPRARLFCSFLFFFCLLLSANIDSMPADDLWQVVLFSTHFLLSELMQCFLIYFFNTLSDTAKGFGERLMSVKWEQICTETGRRARLVL